MSEQLRAGVVAASEEFSHHLALGEYGDPHAAFVVLVHPDAPPDVIALAPAGCHHLRNITGRTSSSPPESDTEQRGEQGRFIQPADVADAANALQATDLAIRGSGYLKRENEKLGAFVARMTRERWEHQRAYEVERTMATAARKAMTPHVCRCGRRFRTWRGLRQHRIRTRNNECRETVGADDA